MFSGGDRMKLYPIGEFAELISRTEQTLRNWDKSGKLKPHHVSDGGHRYYSQQQLNHFWGIREDLQPKRKTIGYCRVSSSKQKEDLVRQVEQVKMFMIAKGYSFEMIEDIGSGMNYTKKGLSSLVDMILGNQVDRIVILYRDRLLRFGYELIESICQNHGVEIEVIDQTPKVAEQEFIEDLAHIVSEFSFKQSGKRTNKTRRIIKELLSVESLEQIAP
jgi:putative resolvase